MKNLSMLVVVLGLSALLMLSGCQTTSQVGTDPGQSTVVAGASQAKCDKPCDQSGDAAKAACCEKHKAEGKCPVASGEKKECPAAKTECSKSKCDKPKCPKGGTPEAPKAE